MGFAWACIDNIENNLKIDFTRFQFHFEFNSLVGWNKNIGTGIKTQQEFFSIQHLLVYTRTFFAIKNEEELNFFCKFYSIGLACMIKEFKV